MNKHYGWTVWGILGFMFAPIAFIFIPVGFIAVGASLRWWSAAFFVFGANRYLAKVSSVW